MPARITVADLESYMTHSSGNVRMTASSLESYMTRSDGSVRLTAASMEAYVTLQEDMNVTRPRRFGIAAGD